MRPDQVLTVQLVDSAGQVVPVPNVFVEVQLFMKGAPRYTFRAGRTDDNGRLRITYGDLEKSRLSNLEAQPWDYKQKLDDCDAKVNVSIPSMEALGRAYEVAKAFNMGEVPENARDWLLANNGRVTSEGSDVDLVDRESTVQVLCLPLP